VSPQVATSPSFFHSHRRKLPNFISSHHENDQLTFILVVLLSFPPSKLLTTDSSNVFSVISSNKHFKISAPTDIYFFGTVKIVTIDYNSLFQFLHFLYDKTVSDENPVIVKASNHESKQ
jgi:hypothetical protein